MRSWCQSRAIDRSCRKLISLVWNKRPFRTPRPPAHVPSLSRCRYTFLCQSHAFTMRYTSTSGFSAKAVCTGCLRHEPPNIICRESTTVHPPRCSALRSTEERGLKGVPVHTTSQNKCRLPSARKASILRSHKMDYLAR